MGVRQGGGGRGRGIERRNAGIEAGHGRGTAGDIGMVRGIGGLGNVPQAGRGTDRGGVRNGAILMLRQVYANLSDR